MMQMAHARDIKRDADGVCKRYKKADINDADGVCKRYKEADINDADGACKRYKERCRWRMQENIQNG